MKVTNRSAGAVWGARGVILGALIFCVGYVADHINFVHGDSVPVTLTWITGGTAQQGDYVYFQAQNPIINKGAKSYLTKRVECVEGMKIDFDGKRFLCDGKAMGGEVLHQTSDGRPVEVTNFRGVIPEGKVFVMGTHERSFDSRYLGLLDRKQITRVEPIL